MFNLRRRNTLPPSTRAELESLTAQLNAFLAREHNDDGTHLVPTWVDYQPALLGHTLGNGRLRGRYLRVGRTIFYRVFFELGTTTSFTTSPIQITLPTPPQVAPTASWQYGAEFLGTAKAAAGTGRYTGVAVVTTGSGVVSVFSDAGFWNDTVPDTWDGSNANQLTLNGWYEVDPA